MENLYSLENRAISSGNKGKTNSIHKNLKGMMFNEAKAAMENILMQINSPTTRCAG